MIGLSPRQLEILFFVYFGIGVGGFLLYVITTKSFFIGFMFSGILGVFILSSLIEADKSLSSAQEDVDQ
jgi:hypothetical protein